MLIATGDIDRLDGRAVNRVVSLTEERTFSSTGVPSFATALNWEIRLRAGEQVTGQLELFQSTVYFASFESGSDPTNLCELGQSRIWAIDYLNEGASPPSGYTDPAAAFPSRASSGRRGRACSTCTSRGRTPISSCSASASRSARPASRA
ncbi:MAG: hypothetical protein M5U28_21480 [Sandaracinaceae bacterium]|nr:hypothetical protein [Sandaracinaceae bacterium]